MQIHNPKIVVGTLGFGSLVTKKICFEILDFAATKGITDIDCAYSYGMGKARGIIAEFQKHTGYKFKIWEKIGLQVHEGSILISSYDDIERLFVELRQIVDVYDSQLHNLQLHVPVPRQNLEKVGGFLREALDKRLISNVGVSNHEVIDLQLLFAVLTNNNIEIFSNQVHVNIAERLAFHSMIPFSKEMGIPVYANRALVRGLISHKNLTESIRFRESLKTRSHESRYSAYLNNIRKLLLSLDRSSIAEIALSWLFHQPGISGIVIGVSSVNQLQSAIKGSERNLMPKEIWAISQFLSSPESSAGDTLPKKLFDTGY